MEKLQNTMRMERLNQKVNTKSGKPLKTFHFDNDEKLIEIKLYNRNGYHKKSKHNNFSKKEKMYKEL
ncbi:hypothetical protein MHTCC0001_33250 [Flavobacteriaceae bacterium MHTCC 0001]